MFTRPLKNEASALLVSIVTGDEDLGRRVKSVLEAHGRYHVDVCAGGGPASRSRIRERATLHLIDVGAGGGERIADLEEQLRTGSLAGPIIVLSGAVDEQTVRRLLKLKIADWLPTTCSDRDLVSACDQAMSPAKQTGAQTQAVCTAFASAVGGAGATTLALAATSILASRGRNALMRCCIVDLDFQRGSVADYLDVEPNLQLDEITARPDRLDSQLLEVMLSRHPSGLAVLAAPAALNGAGGATAEVVGRILDLASAEFDHVIIDLPSHWLPWCETVVRGADAFHLVTDLTVAGLRHARRLAELLGTAHGVQMTSAVIVNKVPWLGGGVSKKQAGEVLGPLLCGFVRDCGDVAKDAQNRGIMLAQAKRSNVLTSDLAKLLSISRPSNAAPGT